MKHGNLCYLEFPREIFTVKYDLSPRALVLYVWLKEFEHYFSDGDDGFFWARDEQLCGVTGYSINTVKLAKKELKNTGLIDVSRGGLPYPTIIQPCRYRLKRGDYLTEQHKITIIGTAQNMYQSTTSTKTMSNENSTINMP